MLISMTGYGYGEAGDNAVKIQAEVKSVNHRFCDVQPRLPREYMALEPRVVTLVRERYGRGRVEVFLRRVTSSGGGPLLRVNSSLARQYVEQLQKLQLELNLPGEIGLASVVAMEGVLTFEAPNQDPERDWPLVEFAIRAALDSAQDMREREGQNLLLDLRQRTLTLEELHAQMARVSRTTTEDAEQRLAQKVQDSLQRMGAGEIDHGRLMQEVVYAVDRSDISEELTRFGSHLKQLRIMLESSEAAGRKIEFLLQELLREVNTTGSKTSSPEVSSYAMLVKVELEKIREQIQNIE